YAYLTAADGGSSEPVGPDRSSCTATLPAESSVSTGGGVDFAPRRGMIVPAYMPIDGIRREFFDPPQDAPSGTLAPTQLEADWQRLIDAASVMSSAQKDF